MNNSLKKREEKLTTIAKQKSFRDTVKHLCGWSPLNLSRENGKLTRYPLPERVGPKLEPEEYENLRDNFSDSHFLSIENKSFFEQLSHLHRIVPQPRLYMSREPENCDFTDMTVDSSNCYLSFVAVRCRNGLYSFNVKDSSDVISSVSVLDNSSLIYESNRIVNSHKVFYSSGIVTSSDIWLSSDLVNCHHCWNCHGAEHLSYAINNICYEQDEYLERIKKIRQDMKRSAYAISQQGDQCIGSENHQQSSWCIKCNNIDHCLNCYQLRDSSNNILCSSQKGSRERHNCYLTGNANHVCDIMHSGGTAEYCFFGIGINRCSHVYYSIRMQTCSFCLGCIGLKNKSYCIFNKQYTKEERYKKVDQIFSIMEEEGSFGQFFPGSMNPFYFNDSAACVIGEFDKGEIINEGYAWRDNDIKVDIPDRMDVVQVNELSNYESHKGGVFVIDPAILKKIIRDEKGNSYRIIKMEYDFLMKHGLPLPRNHWLKRLKGHFRQNKKHA